MDDHRPDPRLLSALRAELAAFVNAAGARRVLPAVFRLGLPGGHRGRDQVAVPDERGFDSGLRADLVERCLEEVMTRDEDRLLLPWLTRGGDLVAHDVDVAWAAAAREGFGRHGLAFPGFYVVTRRGWMNLESSLVTAERVRRRRRTARG